MRERDGDNIEITPEEIGHIRKLSDFDLKMFLSEFEEFGWNQARALLPFIKLAEPRN